MSFKESAKREFTTYAWVLIPIAVGINLVGSIIAKSLMLPVYLDAIGTILGGVLVGPLVGGLIGLLTNTLKAILFNPISLAFAIVNVVIGLLAGYFAKKGFFKSIYKTIIASIVIAIVAGLVSSPIAAYFFGGITGSGKDALTAFFMATGKNMYNAVLTSSILSDVGDKIISCLVVYFVMKGLPSRYVDNLKSY